MSGVLLEEGSIVAALEVPVAMLAEVAQFPYNLPQVHIVQKRQVPSSLGSV